MKIKWAEIVIKALEGKRLGPHVWLYLFLQTIF